MPRTDREAFERYMRSANPGTPLDRQDEGYGHPFANDTWEGFRAGMRAGRKSCRGMDVKDMRETDELLGIWQNNFDSGVRPDDDQPDEQALWDRIVAIREIFDAQGARSNRP